MPSRCTAVEGCLPTRRVDRDRLCLTDAPDRCDLFALRVTWEAPVDRGIAQALRDKDTERRGHRLLTASVEWLRDLEPSLLERVPPAERIPAQALLRAALATLQGQTVASTGRLVHDPALCVMIERIVQVLRLAGRRASRAPFGPAAAVLEVGAGLLPGGRAHLSW